jgi:hypothetical protein
VDKFANVLNKLPKSEHSKVKRSLQEIWMAETSAAAETAVDVFLEIYQLKFERLPDAWLKTATHCWRSTISMFVTADDTFRWLSRAFRIPAYFSPALFVQFSSVEVG